MRKNMLTTLATALIVVGCKTADPNAGAEAVLTGYIAAAAAESAYEALPTANPGTVTTIKACDNAAYTIIGPMNTALMAGTAPTTAVLNNAQAALTQFQACLTSAGVKI